MWKDVAGKLLDTASNAPGVMRKMVAGRISARDRTLASKEYPVTLR
jgi:hypothetical protein